MKGKFTGGNCCCCLDLYTVTGVRSLWKYQLTGDSYPNVKVSSSAKKSLQGIAPAIDLHNEIAFAINGTGLPVAPLTINRFDLNFNNRQQVALIQGDVTNNTTLAVIAKDMAFDWKNRRLFYSSSYNFDSTFNYVRGQIRVVNYDGTGDTRITTEEGTEEGGIWSDTGGSGNLEIPRGLTYNPGNDRLYYFFTFNKFFSPPPVGGHSEIWTKIKSVKSDGSGKQEHVVKHWTESDPKPWHYYRFMSLDISAQRSKLVYILQDLSRASVSPSFSQSTLWTMYYADLDGSGETQILQTNQNPTGDVLLDAQVSEKDDIIYFLRMVNPQSTRANRHLQTINFDGTNERTLFNDQIAFNGSPGNPTSVGLVDSTQPDQSTGTGTNDTNSRLELGCGFETRGFKYTGPG